MADVLDRQDGLYTLITRSAHETTVRVIGSIVDYIHASPETGSLVRRIAHPDTRIVSLTLTEGGYPVDEETRRFDFSAAPAGPDSAFGIIVAALEHRQRHGVGPLTVVSCDNVIGNGDVAKTATLGVAEEHNPKLRNWIEGTVPFPNSMVDRITPATTETDRDWLAQEYGIADGWPVVSEPFRQWVIEDSFEGDRPPWEEVGVTVTSDVEPYELMKLRLLNAGHSCMAYLAALAGIERVDSAMAEPGIVRFLRRFLECEAGPVLPKIAAIDVPAYTASLLERFSNPAIGDQISRLCLDGSAKFPKFLLPTVRAQLALGGPINLAALALAGWCSYLVGVADDGAAISHASDPDLETARSFAAASADEPLRFLAYRSVFGDDLPLQPRFVDAFVSALSSLRSVGVRSTLAASVTPGNGW
jgi:mannitol 2-dehydrogenase